MEPFRLKKANNTLHLADWEGRFPKLVAGFTLRMEGYSEAPYESNNMGLHVGDHPTAVVKNRQKLSEQNGFSFSSFTCGDQVHGINVTNVTSANKGAGADDINSVIPDTDGLYTNQPDIMLATFYADCVPLFFIDPASKAIGLAHAGWKGTVGGISKEMVFAMSKAYDTHAEDLLVAIGPCIGPCCYEVDDRVIDHVKQASPLWQECVAAKGAGRYMLDLSALNQYILVEAGIRPEHILRSSYCTSCRVDMFFSHRKEHGTTGRMASFIGWQS